MIDQPPCPVCDNRSWDVISEQTFVRATKGLSPYTALRYEILFDQWAPGSDRLTIRYLLCDRCGLVIYAPRPTAQEVSAKYARLGGASSSTVTDPIVMPIDRRRSTEILSFVAPHLPPQASVLDFGGGTGSLMASFLEAGCSCAVVDYAAEAIPGVERVADTLDGIPAGRRFDLIIANHVLEHVPDPLDTVRSLVAQLAEGGHLYVEVPLELVGGAPRRAEPVTHINFFAEPSLRALLQRAGLETARCCTAATTHASGRHVLAVCALATSARDGETSAPEGGARTVAQVRRMLQLGPMARAAHFLRYPGRLLNPLRRLRTKRGW